MLRDNVLHTFRTWGFHESLLSIVIPENVIWETHSNGESSIIISAGKASMVLLNIMYLVFCKLRDNLLALIH